LEKRLIHRLVLGFFIAAVVVGLALRLVSIANKHTWEQDEATFYLAAAVHQAEYHELRHEDLYPFERWSSGSDWIHFITLQEPFAFNKISYGLSLESDTPPLYIWLLHMWASVWGFHSWTGPTLNLVFTILLALLLAWFTQITLGNRLVTFGVVALWLLRPIPVDTLLLARHYTLLPLVTLLVAILIWRFLYRADAQPLKPLSALWLVLAIAAGYLTHYYFPLAVLAGCIALFLRYGFSKRLWQLVGAAFAALPILIVCHPYIFDQWTNMLNRRGSDFDFRTFDDRIANVIDSVLSMFFDGVNTHFAITSYSRLLLPALLLLLVVLGLVYFAIRNRARLQRYIAHLRSSERVNNQLYAWCFLLVLVGGQYLLYLSFFSPSHAITTRYLNLPWTFMVMLPFLITLLLPPRVRQWAFGLIGLYCIGVLVGAVALMLNGGVDAFPEHDLGQPGVLAEYDTLLVDNEFRELMVPLSLHMQPEDSVYVRRQYLLIEQPETWLPRFASTGGLYVTVPDIFGGTTENRDTILAMMQACGLTGTRVPATWFFETYVVDVTDVDAANACMST
jgi:hypothetical protein